MVSLLNLFKYLPMLLTVIYPISLPVKYQKTDISSMLKQLQKTFKKDHRTKIKNYRPASLLSMFSKIYGRLLTNYANTFLSKFISAYHKSCCTSHVLIRLTESRCFWLHTHNLLIAKMYAYGWFFINAVTFFYSYLKRRNQNIRINNTHSVFQVLLSRVLQALILGPLLSNIFINDLYLWITKT